MTFDDIAIKLMPTITIFPQFDEVLQCTLYFGVIVEFSID